MCKYFIKKITVLFVGVMVAWISFVPEPLQEQSRICTNSILLIFLILSLWVNNFGITNYFLKREDGLFWGYLFCISLNIWFAKDRNAAALFLRNFSVIIIAIYFILKNSDNINLSDIKKILYFFCLCSALVSIFGIVEIITNKNILYANYLHNDFYIRFVGRRMMSTLAHPNILGSYLITIVPLSYYFYEMPSSPRLKGLNFIILILSVIALLGTFSRGTWTAFVVVLCFWLSIKKNIMWTSLFLFLVILFSILSSYSIFGEVFKFRFGIIDLFTNLRFNHRVTNYLVSWNMLKQHPLVGIGLNNYRMFFLDYSNNPLWYEVRIPDSIYLMHLAETGILGFLGFTALLINLFFKSKKTHANLDEKEKKFFFAILLGFLGLLINMAFFDGFLWSTTLFLFWILFALISKFNNTKKVLLV